MYRIGQLAKLSDVSKRTIDYYTQIGLLKTAETTSKFRSYPEHSLERLKLIEHYKQQHMTLKEIRKQLEMFDDDTIAEGNVLEKVNQIQAQIEGLEKEVLELQPLLKKLDENQLKLLTKQLSAKGMSLVHIIAMISEGSLML
ncbi:MerR family transcriptional regulator [Priestia koreensis]|uniref:MerR family transcriptional regulator n=1 Tax=Priestia koreensis TaxID=284581 RepID=UPI001F586DBC|nr:MerR family transcriptional regulator [Priestia koreensis]UNL85745.1 MerR family transcriptional regulator [Priestia koreensis]